MLYLKVISVRKLKIKYRKINESLTKLTRMFLFFLFEFKKKTKGQCDKGYHFYKNLTSNITER